MPNIIYILISNAYTDYYKLKDYLILHNLSSIISPYLKSDMIIFNYIKIYYSISDNKIYTSGSLNITLIDSITYKCLNEFISADIIDEYVLEKLL